MFRRVSVLSLTFADRPPPAVTIVTNPKSPLMNEFRLSDRRSYPASSCVLQPLREVGVDTKSRYWDEDEIEDAIREARTRGIQPESLFATSSAGVLRSRPATVGRRSTSDAARRRGESDVCGDIALGIPEALRAADRSCKFAGLALSA